MLADGAGDGELGIEFEKDAGEKSGMFRCMSLGETVDGVSRCDREAGLPGLNGELKPCWPKTGVEGLKSLRQ